MSGWERRLLILEILISYLPCTLMLVMGAMLPMQVMFLVSDSLHWEGPALVLISVPCGIVGLCSLPFVVSLLFAGSERIERPIPVLGAVFAGAVPLLLRSGTISGKAAKRSTICSCAFAPENPCSNSCRTSPVVTTCSPVSSARTSALT